METVSEMAGRIDQTIKANKEREGATTKKLERVTAALPSSTWLILAGGALLGSLGLKVMGRDKTATFVGQWVPTLLLLGIYNKIVKVAGSDQKENRLAH